MSRHTAEFAHEYWNTLAERVRDGDTGEALDRLIRSLRAEIDKAVYRVTSKFRWIDPYDVESRLTEAVWRSCDFYQRERGNYIFYLFTWWNGIAQELVKHHNRNKRRGNNTLESIDAMVESYADKHDTMTYDEEFDAGIVREELRSAISEMLSGMTELEKNICLRVMDGKSHRQIAQELALPNAMSVGRTLKKLRNSWNYKQFGDPADYLLS